MELDAIAGAVIEIGDRLGVPMPSTRAVYACAKLLDARSRQVGAREIVPIPEATR